MQDQPKKDTSGRTFLSQIAGAAEGDPQKQQVFHGGGVTVNPSSRSKDPVSPLSPAEEQLWKDYAQCYARRLNKM